MHCTLLRTIFIYTALHKDGIALQKKDSQLGVDKYFMYARVAKSCRGGKVVVCGASHHIHHICPTLVGQRRGGNSATPTIPLGGKS